MEEKHSHVMSEKGLFPEYKFSKFAAMHFQDNATHTFIHGTIRQSLTPLETVGDQIAALAVWITILRFMGELPDPKISSFTTMYDSEVSTDHLLNILNLELLYLNCCLINDRNH